MILSVDPNSDTPVYRQIVDGLRIALVNGALAPGDALPAVRRLALDVGVHFNTVAQAYRALAREGWLDIGIRTGARVKERPVQSGLNSEADVRRRLEELVAKLQALGIRRPRLVRELRRIAQALEVT
jgi:GntR family transcriptional regulator